MPKKLRKILLLVVKLAIAAGLLVWVVSQVHWYDYVVEKVPSKTDASKFDPGAEYSIPGQFDPKSSDVNVQGGRLWWKSPIQTMPKSKFIAIGDDPNSIVRWGVKTTLNQMDKLLFAIAVVGFLLPVLIFSVRWWFLLRIQRIQISLVETARLTILGQFFNYVLPSTVGGDLVKAWYVAKNTDKKAAVLVSLFVDRLLGLTELVLMASVMLAVVYFGGLEKNPAVLKDPAIMVAIVVAAVIGAMAFILSKRFRGFFHLDKIYGKMKFAHHIAAAGDAANLYRRRVRVLVQAILITIGGHASWIGSIAILGASLHIPTPWYSYFMYIPLIYIIGAIPLTPGGVGLIEKMFLVFFAAVNPSSVLVLALFARLLQMFWALPGALFAIIGPRRPKAEEMEAQLAAAEEAELQVAQSAAADGTAESKQA